MNSIATADAAQRIGTRINIADRLTEMAGAMPDAPALVAQLRRRGGKYRYRAISFAELEADSNRLAAGMVDYGLRAGTRIALLVRPGIDFVSLTFALFKAGAVTILIDPGMGKENLLQCLEDAQPEGFVAIPLAHALRVLHHRRFPLARLNVTVGRRWFWGGPTVGQLRQTDGEAFRPIATAADDPAAIIFTSGSTGPPKGVLYQHGNFDAQVQQIRDHYEIAPGGVDLAGFPLFGLFNSAMGMTSIIPAMDASRPAQVDPRAIVAAMRDWNVTQSFASPAVWNVVGRHCCDHEIQLPTLRRVLSAGAPVPPHVLRRMRQTMAADGEIHTPYGPTESLPVASISASEVLQETANRSAAGAGTCVGRRFSRIDWKVIRIVDGPVPCLDEIEALPTGEIGELIVSGPVITREYVTRQEANADAKIADGPRVWHRMGDVGYLDHLERFWFCGRKAHRVLTAEGPMYTVPCEGIFNEQPEIYRSALVGVGPAGDQTPVIICEPWKEHWPRTSASRQTLIDQLAARGRHHPLTSAIRPEHILLHPSLPVDVRHNAKISREKLADWATTARK